MAASKSICIRVEFTDLKKPKVIKALYISEDMQVKEVLKRVGAILSIYKPLALKSKIGEMIDEKHPFCLTNGLVFIM